MIKLKLKYRYIIALACGVAIILSGFLQKYFKWSTNTLNDITFALFIAGFGVLFMGRKKEDGKDGGTGTGKGPEMIEGSDKNESSVSVEDADKSESTDMIEDAAKSEDPGMTEETGSSEGSDKNEGSK